MINIQTYLPGKMQNARLNADVQTGTKLNGMFRYLSTFSLMSSFASLASLFVAL
ncbi:hypothetical protein SAMN05660293_01960 [Dyadobacter psychrophilus]|uniref:Uncharacterized protein n=1 Tax=Dyadobacter psychrophilus TaxID=651661 RepID=A0A1T5DW85_9BACT|nr:hypothetical protein SAMN05660293_01960 [Dyadobacter psychrophilus]